MNIPTNSSLFITIILFAAFAISCTTEKADIILTNGKIFTSDSTQLYVEALAIKGNVILAAGKNETIQTFASSQTKTFDLKGRTVVPGFNDAHDHPGWDAPIGNRFSYNEFNPMGLTKQSVLDSVSRLVKTTKPNQWIYGSIGTSVLNDSSMRIALDKIAPNNPVLLQIWWGHGQVVNKKALDACGVSDNDPDPIGGWYSRNKMGLIYALHENAEAPFWFALYHSEPENLIKGLQAYAQTQLRNGITSIQYMGTGFKESEAKDILLKAQIQQRVRMIGWPASTEKGRSLDDWKSGNISLNNLTSISGIKYVIDGTPFEQNSLNRNPYHSNWYGRLNYPIDTIKQILKEALSSERQLCMHIVGDSTLSVVLKTMKEVGSAKDWKNKRVRIEHSTSPFVTETEIEMIKEMGLLLMHTPKYGQPTKLKSFIDRGLIVGIAPDGTVNPFWDIMVMTTQQANQSENLTREQAVIAYTKTNAFAEFDETKKGVLANGMLADLAVLSQDIFTIPHEQLPATKSILTIVDGQIVHEDME